MNRFTRIAVMIPVLALGLALAGCETFDPTDLTEMFNTKKKLPGERKPVFPEGMPGVPQGVPQELVKGYEPPAEPEPQPEAGRREAKAEAQGQAPPRWWPSRRSSRARRPSPCGLPARSRRAAEWPDPPKAQQPAAAPWPNNPQKPAGQVAWPDPPPPGSFSR